MWTDVVAAGAAVVGALVSANWLTSGASRHLKRLSAEAELWSNLPDCEGKEKLAEWLNESSHRYALHRFFGGTKRWMIGMLVIIGAGLTAAIWTMALAAVSILSEDPPGWLPGAVLVGIVVTVIAIAFEKLLRPFAERSMDPVVEEAERQMRDTGRA